MNSKKSVTALIQAILGVVFFIAMLTVLHACGPKEDGSFMHCHDAWHALIGLSAVMMAVSLWHLFTVNRTMRRIADILLIVLAAAVLVIPGHVISLCMMPDMQCRAVMQPGATVFAILFVIASAADLLLKGKHQNRDS